MKKTLIALVLICFFAGSAFAGDYCDIKYGEYMAKLKSTSKIHDDAKGKYMAYLQKAYELCKADKMNEAREVFDEMQDEFLRDALYMQQTFYGH